VRWGRKFGIALASVTVLMTANVVQATAQDPDFSWPPQFTSNWGPGSGQIGFIINDKFSFESAIRVLIPGAQPMCKSLDDSSCSALAEEHGWWILRVAPPCAIAMAWEECVESLSIVGEDGVERQSTFMGLAPGKSQFAGDPERGLPTGSALGLWSDPLNPGGNTGYAVELSGQMGGRSGPFTLGTFSAQVTHYRVGPWGSRPSCIWQSSEGCAYRIAFDEGVRLNLDFLMNGARSGWLSGRVQDPRVSVEQARDGLDRISVSALPVDLPMVATSIPVSSAGQEIKDYWRETTTCPGPRPCEDGVMGGESDGPHSNTLLRLFSTALGDTATKVIPTWSIASLNGSVQGGACLNSSDSLVGLVTTNATVYESGPPQFVESSLRYSVAALHRVPGGDVLRGSYNLVMRSDVARCLYGFSQAPVKVEIQVLSEDGTEQVSATSVSESDGWLSLAATGFTFSNPTISVTLSQTPPPSPPAGVRASLARTGVRVSWQASPHDSASPAPTYTATASPGGQSCAVSEATECTITDLDPGVTYSFAVTAANEDGTSAPSTASSPVTYLLRPGAVRDAKVVETGAGKAKVTWLPPESLGGAQTVAYRVRVNKEPWRVLAATSLPLRGQKPNAKLTVWVKAINGAGSGPVVVVTGRSG
jgi:hypothetical protein